MTRDSYRRFHRLARCGALGTLATTTDRDSYQWFLSEVYDTRHPHIGDDRHEAARHTWDPLARNPVKMRRLRGASQLRAYLSRCAT